MRKTKLMNKGKGKKVVALFLALCFVTLSGRLIAGERQGAKLLITKKDGQTVLSELVAAKQNSIVVLSYSGADEAINVSDIRSVEIMKHSRMLEGVVCGILVCGMAGLAIGSANDPPGFMHGIKSAEGAGIGALAGVPVGLVLGHLLGSPERFQIEGKSPEEVKAILEKLRSKGRVPDFQ